MVDFSSLRKLARNVSKILCASLASRLLTFLSMVIYTRLLQPEAFGVFGFGLKVLLVSAAVSRMGLPMSAVHHMAESFAGGKEDDAHTYFMATGILQLTMSCVVLVIGMCFAGMIAASIFARPELADIIKVAAFGVAGSQILQVSQIYFQARERFTAYSTLMVTVSILNLAGAALLACLGIQSAIVALALWVSSNFLVGLVAMARLPAKVYRVKAGLFQAARNLLRLSKWLYASQACNYAWRELDTFFLVRHAGLASVGIYTVGLQLAQVVGLFSNALSSVMLVHISKQGNKTGNWVRTHMAIVFAAVLACLAAIGPLIYYSDFFVTICFGEQYLGSAVVFRVVVFASLLAVLYSNWSLVFIGLKAPQWIMLQNFLQLAAAIIAYSALIPSFGVSGAAWGLIIVQATGMLIVVLTLAAGGSRFAEYRLNPERTGQIF